ncbi:hypothetical protein ABVC73_15145 [Prevotella melaninogenica]
MKKILYINYIHQKGHYNFDKIHINALDNENAEILLILHSEEKKALPYSDDKYCLVLPKCFSTSFKSGFFNRIIYICTLLYIFFKVNFKEYSDIVLASMEEISIFLIPLKKNKFIICHNNACGLTNKIKKPLLRLIGAHNTFIVFNKRMKDAFLSEKIINTKVISHGCLPAYKFNDNIDVLLNLKNYKTIIFHPSSAIDFANIEQLYKNDSFLEFLRKENILLILKTPNLKTNIAPNIINITKYLSKEEYQNLFLKSDYILLSYPQDFGYRVSGVSYECFSNKKRMLIHSNPSFDYCKDYFNYNPFYNSNEELIALIKKLQNNQSLQYVAESKDLTPDYSKILQL